MKKLIMLAIVCAAPSIGKAAMPVREAPYELCVSTVMTPTALTVSTVPTSVRYSTSSTGSPAVTIDTWKDIEFQNIGGVNFYIGFNVAVTTLTGRGLINDNESWSLHSMENVRTWIIPENTAGSRVIVTYCR